MPLKTKLSWNVFGAAAAWVATIAMMSSGKCAQAQTQSPNFQRDILPVLSDSCFSCHGPDAGQRQSGLRLDVREEAVDYGAIDPDDPDASLILQRIESDDPDVMMPPPNSRRALKDREMKLIRDWIASGAEYKKHWAWEAPVRPEVPQAGEGWARNSIDRFVAQRLEQNGLQPAHRARAETLARRLSLDLVGLPPGEDFQKAARDEFSDAIYDDAVKQLLASPHYGERMAAAWLDVVRYADTVGYHGDQNINVFPYRDWVIDAMNDNMPYDQFARWQIAGDLIENPTAESRTASAFNRLNMVTREGGAQPGEYLAKYSADRVRSMGTAFLGMTIACAECHDHKFDPIRTRDFYGMAAFFADLKQWGVYQDYGYTPNPDLRGWSNDHPFPPELEVTSSALARRLDSLRQKRDEVVASSLKSTFENPATKKAFDNWLDGLRASLRENETGWIHAKPVNEPTAENSWEIEPGGILRLTGKDTRTFQANLRPETKSIASIRLELMGESADANRIVADKAPQSTIQLKLQRTIAAEKEAKSKDVRIHFADSERKLPRYSNGFEIDGIQGGWIVRGDWPTGTDSVWVLDQPIDLADGETLDLTVSGNIANRIRLSVSPMVPLDPRYSIAWEDDIARLSDDGESSFLGHQWVAAGNAGTSAQNEWRKLNRQIRDCRDGVWPVVVSEALPKPMETRVLKRGDWQDTSGEIVPPGTPAFLPPLLKKGSDPLLQRVRPLFQQRLTRLDLANWLVQPDHPLTARVQMNRLWKHFFGTGLSEVLDDLGAQGQHPSHPELLDWLAVEFRESGWDMKHMVRLVVGSATYQQSAQPSEEAIARDPANTWLSHQNARRLEAEIIRDNALAVAGLLNLEIGGPPAFPYQPDDYYSQLQFPDRRYRADDDQQQFRRGIYMHWQRTFLHPMLANFDAPSREECTGMRIEANTPLQALTLLNDPTYVEAARKLAELSMKNGSPVSTGDDHGDSATIQWLVLRVLARDASEQETASLAGFLANQRMECAKDVDAAKTLLKTGISPVDESLDPTELAARTELCRVLLNLHETITRY